MNQIEEDEIDFSKLIGHLKRNLKTILVITFLITTLAAGYAYFLQPTYSSSVSISFSDQKMSKLSSIIPDELAGLGTKESELETIKLTIETRKFINSVIKEMSLDKRYYIEKHLKKVEVYDFKNLAIDLTLDYTNFLATEETLYGKYFKIEFYNSRQYLLTCDSLDYSEVHSYGKLVVNDFFSIKVSKKGSLEHTTYFIKSDNKTLLADNILKNLRVAILSDNVLTISYDDSLARRAKELIDAIGKKFIAYTLEKKTNEIGQTLHFLDTQIDEIKSNLENEGNILKGYQEKSNAFMPLATSKLLMESIAKKEEALKVLKFQYAEVKEFRKALLENRLNTVSLLNSGVNTSSIQSLVELFREESFRLNEMNLQSNNIEKSIIDNAQLSDLINQLNKKKKLLIDLEFNFTQGHPQVVQAQNEIASLEDDIRAYISTHIEKLEINKKLTKNKIVNNIGMTEQSLKRKIREFTKDIKEQEKSLRLLPEKSLMTQELKRRFVFSEKVYTFLLERKMDFEIMKASTIAKTQIIEDAREGLKPIKPNKKLIVVVGFILGLILGIFFTFLRAMLDTKIRDAATVVELTDTPLYGILPDKANNRFFDEALRNIRTNLYFVLPNEKKCVTMLISSTVPGEGKTTVIASLAKIVAQTNKKVLLIDLDLRKPRLYQEIRKSNKIGVTNYLVEDKSIEELLQPISDNLDFIAAGAVPPNPSELLMSGKFETLLNELKEQYDYILVDTPPMGMVIDALLILKYIDITLLVVRANKSEKVYLENFNKLKIEKDIKSAGIIVNQVKLSNNGTGYGAGYGAGYGYGDTQHKGA